MEPQQFRDWSFEIRGDGCYVVTNEISSRDDRPDTAVVWSNEQIDVPDGVTVDNMGGATGEASAVQDKNVSGYIKYELSIKNS